MSKSQRQKARQWAISQTRRPNGTFITEEQEHQMSIEETFSLHHELISELEHQVKRIQTKLNVISKILESDDE